MSFIEALGKTQEIDNIVTILQVRKQTQRLNKFSMVVFYYKLISALLLQNVFQCLGAASH